MWLRRYSWLPPPQTLFCFQKVFSRYSILVVLLICMTNPPFNVILCKCKNLFLRKHLLLMYNVWQNSFGKSGRRSERPQALIWIWAAAELKLEKLEISVPNCLKRNSTRRGKKKNVACWSYFFDNSKESSRHTWTPLTSVLEMWSWSTIVTWHMPRNTHLCMRHLDICGGAGRIS